MASMSMSASTIFDNKPINRLGSDTVEEPVKPSKSIFSYFAGGSASAIEPNFEYQRKKTFDERLSESRRVSLKHPEHIPIIIEPNPKSTSEKIDMGKKNRFLISKQFNVGQFLHVIRKQVKLTSEQGIFIFTEKDELIPTSMTNMSIVYDHHKNPDGFLYLHISRESVFG